jgi:hypothetical protein
LKPSDFPLSLSTKHLSQVTIHGVDVFHPSSGEVRSDGADGIACWFIDTDYNEESFFVRHAYFLGANDPYKSLKTTLKAEINEDAWATLNSDTSRPFAKPNSGRIAVKVINHLGDEVMKVFRVHCRLISNRQGRRRPLALSVPGVMPEIREPAPARIRGRSPNSNGIFSRGRRPVAPRSAGRAEAGGKAKPICALLSSA